MVSWSSTASVISGYDPITRKTIADAFFFATNGQVTDIGGATRLGRKKPVLPNGGIRGVRVKAVIDWSATDGDYLSDHQKTYMRRGMTVFVAPTAGLPANPTPQQVMDAAPTNLIKRFLNPNWNNGTWTYNFEYWEEVELQPNTKYAIVLLPVIADQWKGASKADRPPVGTSVNAIARGLTFWTDRTPNAPVITSPSNNTVVDPGAVVTLTIQPNDPDALTPDDATRYNRDLAGLIVEYAAPPTPENPRPEWTLLPYTLPNGNRGMGSFAYRTNTPSTAYSPKMIEDLGFPIRAGADNPPAGHAGLPTGTWLIRARTIGFGNPFPETNGVGGAEKPDGPWTPTANPASPWSEPIKITVPGRVPVPLAVAPVKGRAMPTSAFVDLRWRYRNLNIPVMPQLFRRVQMRKPTDVNWTTVSESFTDSDTYRVAAPQAGVPNVFVDLGNSATNWVGSAAGATGSPTVVDGRIRMARVASTWPDATKTGPVTLTRSSISGITSTAKVTIKGRRLMADNPVPGQTMGVTAAFRTGVTVRKAYLHSSVNAGNTFASSLEDFELVYYAEAGFNNITVSLVGQDGMPATLEIDEIRVDTLSSGFDYEPTTEYEWRVQAVDTGGAISGYSQPARFWVVEAPNSGDLMPVPSETLDGATLGRGTHRAFIYRRGGLVQVGELKGVVYLDWSRVRDEMSTARVEVKDWDIDDGNLLASLDPWAYELVIYRNSWYENVRVWEGPITLLTYEAEKVAIDAKDVLGYLYRRAMRSEMNDSKAPRSVVTRSTQIVQDAFAPDDPNVLAYLNPITREDDPTQYRNTPEYSRTAYEEIDDMASNSGLDYTAIGRSIVLWGTRHRIGTLPELTDTHFSDPPKVSVYGMRMANRYIVSDGNGLWGAATRNLDPVSGNNPYYGLVEMLSSTWASDSDVDSGTFTDEQREKVIKSFTESAERSIDDRYPAPVVVRVPDNTTLLPETPLSIQQLVPGVVIPLRARGTLREVVGSQKLDSVKVTESEGRETITVVMSPFSRDDASMEEGEQ